jgi:general secretion pathway protein F/type IV pilus assembly protein PilC
MPQFNYLARTASGDDVTGVITAASHREGLNLLAERGVFALRVEPARASFWQWRPARRIKTRLLATNLSQLADLLKNGVPLLKSLEVLAEQAVERQLAEVLASVRDQVAEGASLDQALARHPTVFSELVVSMIRAGSEGAFLEEALKRTADFLEMQEDLKWRVVGAMTYPAVLAGASVLVTFVLVVFFVPKFATLFIRLEREGGGLPWPTVALLGLSAFLRRFGLLLVVALGVGGLWLHRVLGTDRGRAITDRLRLKIPVAGPIFLQLAVARFCRVLGTLMRNGVPLLRALEISGDSTGNRVLAGAIRSSAENVTSGESLSRPLAACGLFPKPVMAMIAVAEEANTLDTVLVGIAETLDRKVFRQLEVMVRMLEPLMLVVMGGVILFILLALLLPVFDMSAAMG